MDEARCLMPNNDSHYRSVSLPRELVDRVEALPLDELGYVSIAEVVKDAIREKLRSLESRRSPKGRGRAKA
jgi:metal-responsive CopG/Arc/MetJ family transcriptional regulator